MSDPRSSAPSGDGSSGTASSDDAPFDPLGFDDDAVSDGRPSVPDSPAVALESTEDAARAADSRIDGLRIAKSAVPRAEAVPGRGPVVPGHVSIAPRALQRVGGAIVAERLRVDRSDVRVDTGDDAGTLTLTVSTPVVIPPLGAVPADQVGVVETIRDLQATVTRRMADVTGRAVSRVDVTVTRSILAGSRDAVSRVDRPRVDRPRTDTPRVDKPRVDHRPADTEKRRVR